MAQSEPEQAPDAAPAPATEATAATRGWRGPGLWTWLAIVVAGLLGLGLGAGVVLRGSSLGPTSAGSTASRPTFVIGAAISPVPGRSPSPVVGRDYVVEPGDTLRSIALSLYGDADQWQRVYSANREAIGADPDALQAGMHLKIP